MTDSELGFVIFLIIIAIVAVGVFTVLWKEKLESACIDNGYAEGKFVGFKRYCVDVRDGDTVVVPLEDLR